MSISLSDFKNMYQTIQKEFNRMLKKIDNGASFFLTQPIYDDETIEFLKSVKERTNTKILGGILPIVTYKNAQFLNNVKALKKFLGVVT